MECAHRSVAKVTASVYSAIKDHMDDDDFIQVVNQVETAVETLPKPLDMRAQTMFTLMLFCSKKVWM